MKIVFVCSAGEDRSPTAARVAKELAGKMGIIDLRTASMGLETVYPDQAPQVVKKADRVVVMEGEMIPIVRNFCKYEGPIENLEIPDLFEGESPELIKILEEKLTPILDKL